MSERSIAVVINPVKRESGRARTLMRAAAREAGFPAPVFIETTQDDPGRAMTREALERGASIVVAAGGDGTVRAVAQELVGAHDVTLGILPMGTGNLLARNLGIDVDDLTACARVAVAGVPEPVDALRIRLVRPDRGVEETVSVVASGLGIDAEVMEETNENLKKAVGPLAYAATTVGKLAPRHRHPIRVSVDHGAWDTFRVRTIVVVNAGYIQGGLQYAPGSRHDDGLQNAVIMSPRSAVGWVMVAARMLRLNEQVPVVKYLEGRRLHVRSFYPVVAQVDGDPVGAVTELDSEVLRHALRVHAPAEEDRLAPGGQLAKVLPPRYSPRRLWAAAKRRADTALGS